MTNEEIIRKQAREIVEQAIKRRYAFVSPAGIRKVIEEIQQQAQRLYGNNKAVFLDAVCMELRRAIAEHEPICEKGPGECKLEQGMDEVLFFTQQELNKVPISALKAAEANVDIEPDNYSGKSFEEKQLHFMRWLYKMGSREHKKLSVNINNDYQLALAEDKEEFLRILESLRDEELILYDEPSVRVREDVGSELLARYTGIILTSVGKQKVGNSPIVPARQITQPEQASAAGLALLHPTIQTAATQLFLDGHYRQAILDAYIALDNAVSTKAQRPKLNGTSMMEKVFSSINPILKLADEQDEQLGFLSLFKGAMMAIRNPKAHSLTGQADPQRAFEWLAFASVLLRKLDEAEVVQQEVRE